MISFDFYRLYKYYELLTFIFKHIQNFVWLVRLTVQYDLGLITQFAKNHADDIYWLFKCVIKISVCVLSALFEFACCSCKKAYGHSKYWSFKILNMMQSFNNLKKYLFDKKPETNNFRNWSHTPKVSTATKDLSTQHNTTPALNYVKISDQADEHRQALRCQMNRSRSKYITISKENRHILNNWLQDNIDYPYATQFDIKALQTQTGLSEKRIRDWLNWQRTNKKELQVPYFSIEDKIIMMRFYNDVSKHPGPQDLELLSNKLQRDWKRIRMFFNKERFVEKNYLLQKRIRF
jgi:hypothetical protein